MTVVDTDIDIFGVDPAVAVETFSRDLDRMRWRSLESDILRLWLPEKPLRVLPERTLALE